MSDDTSGMSVKEKGRARDSAMAQALGEFSSNIKGLIVTDYGATRFLKLLYRDDGSWLAIAGSLDEDGAPIVCFGNGVNSLKALYILGRAMANDEWRVDKYASG